MFFVIHFFFTLILFRILMADVFIELLIIVFYVYILCVALQINSLSKMSCIDLKPQFLSYLNFNPHQSSFYNAPTFMKSCNQAMVQVQTLKIKINQFDTAMNRGRLRSNADQQNKMLHNLNDNIKICQNHLKRLQVMVPDMKNSSDKFVQEYKASILTTLEMKLLQSGLKFKQSYQKNRKLPKNAQNSLSSNSLSTNQQSQQPNLSRPLFIAQTQQQLMQQISISEYKGIQKSMAKISQMFKQTASIVRMHQFMIDSIQTNINETQGHVQGGKKNLSQAHRREARNRPFILKMFAILYLTVTVYIVFIS